METLRTFIAVPVSDEVRATVASVEENLRPIGADVKWVDPRNVHLTLKFLGNVDAAKLGDIAPALTSALAATNRATIEVAGAGTFPPGRKNVRVIWLGITEGSAALVEMAGLVDQACASMGFAREERPFSPHLTIGRVRRESGRLADLARGVSAVQFNPLKVNIDRVNLMRSELSPKGPTYTVLDSFALSESGKGGGVWI
ncbi:MAG TPA: RNA 2',3'-cyclic phosphodiesterase [bacterium]|nr:RNA 2',3'-cyclic phosphodiesterase [bacterium]